MRMLLGLCLACLAVSGNAAEFSGQGNDSLERSRYGSVSRQRDIGVKDPYAVISEHVIPLPAPGIPFYDPPFNTTLRRITDAPAGGFERHEYSQLQAFNADGSLILLDNGAYIIREVSTLSLVGLLPAEANSPRWDPASSDEILHFDSNDVGSGNVTVTVQRTNVRTGATVDVFTLPGIYERVAPSISWEQPSRDGRWMGAYLYRTDGNTAFVAIDLVNLQLGAQLTLNGDLNGGRCTSDGGGPNWVAASPSGQYLVIQWNATGVDPCNGVEVYDIDTGSYLGHVASHRNHSDMGFDENGDEMYFTDYYLNSNFLTVTLFPGSTSFDPNSGYDRIVLDPGWNHLDHVSCQGPKGVCVVTAGGSPGEPFAGEIYLVFTSGSAQDGGLNDDAQVLRLAHHRSTSCEYYHQPHASLSVDGRYAVFASDWGSCPAGANDYLIDLSELNLGSAVFSDGFESGDTTRWAVTVY